MSERDEAKRRLHALNATILMAVEFIRTEKATLDAYFAELEHVDSVMPMIDPTLWMSRERQRTEAVLTPIYRAALDLVQVYDNIRSTFLPTTKDPKP